MPDFTTLKTLSYSKIQTVLATKVVKVTVDGVEDTDFTFTVPSDGDAEVEILIRAKVKHTP